MTFAAVLHGFDQVGAAIPFGAAVDIRFVALIGIEEYRPDTHQCALIERERERVPRRWGMQRFQREEVCLDRERIGIGVHRYGAQP